VVPTTDSISECLLSTLRTIKAYFRMGQERLDNMLVLHVHKERVAALDHSSITEKFVAASEYWLTVYGKFI